MSKDKYFAADTSEELVLYMQKRAGEWFQTLTTSKHLDKMKRSWGAYHGVYYEDSHAISFSGEQGELVNLPVNHYRNIAQNILTMVTATRPAFQARAINTDLKSQIQTNLANGLLEYYMRDKRLEMDLKRAVEYSVVMGAGYIKMEWNATSGEVYDVTEAEVDEVTGEEVRPGFPIYEGDVEFSVLSPFDVVFDSTKENNKHDWQLCRTFKNKFDIAAKYPEMEEQIVAMKSKSDESSHRISLSPFDETVDVPVYEFFHRPTEALPRGRYVLFLDHETILVDTTLPYKKLPIFRISPSDILGTPYGYTSMFDLLPIQDAVNSLYSTILTNQHTFGVQNIYATRDSGITMTELSSGLNLIEGNPETAPPQALNLTQTPGEIFNFLQMLERAMETVSGINSVARGNPDPKQNLRSGNALALIQSQALQFISGLQQSYIYLIEDVGTNLVTLLQDFASVPRVAQISGKSNVTYMKEFTGDDLGAVNRVIVDAGNALAQCLEKGTEVLMANGTKCKVEDINVGDLVMGPDSKSRTVSNVNTGEEMMYKVVSKDKHMNVSYGCNESHILTLRYCSDDARYNAKKGDTVDLSVREYQKLPGRQKRLLQGFRTPIEYDKKHLEVPPYVLGSWLGDGTSATTALTTKDVEILHEWRKYSSSIGTIVRESTGTTSGKAKTYHVTSGEANGSSKRNPFMNELRAMELIDNKHIPFLYMTGSREQRLELLAGLIDTDGSRLGETYIFTQKSERITKDVIALAQSLGFKVKYGKKKIYPSTLVPNATGFINSVTIGGNTWEIPCRVPRKQCQAKEKQANWLNYGINVIPVGEGTYYGFTLKEEPHFVLGDCTVTHNTTAGRSEMATQMMQMNLIKTPEEYLSVINTGKLETMTESQNKQLLLIRAENERLTDGKVEVMAVLTDDHNLHLREHQAVLADPDLRMDAELVDRTLGHIQEHINILSDPNVAQILLQLGQTPIQSPAPMAPGGMSPEGGEGAPPAAMASPQAGSQQDPNLLNNPEAQAPDMQAQMAGELPQPALPAENELGLPQTGQDAFNRLIGG